MNVCVCYIAYQLCSSGKEASHAILARPDNAWNYPKQRSTLKHLTDNTPCFCGAGR